jgi:hypothetical protein
MRAPFHVRMALSDAESALANRDSQNGSRLIAAALLKALGEAKLIDIKPGIEQLYRNNKVHEVKTMRKLIPQVDRTITRLARRPNDDSPSSVSLQLYHPNKKTARRRFLCCTDRRGVRLPIP